MLCGSLVVFMLCTHAVAEPILLLNGGIHNNACLR
jgi:hypothetical protein